MLRFLSIVFLIGLISDVSADCKSPQGSRCIPKKELPSGFGASMLGGDPCFLDGDDRWCFVSKTGNMEPCTCDNADCGCGVAPVLAKCDNSEAPKNPNCKADQSKFCSLLDKDKNANTMCKYCGVNIKACNNKLCTRGLSDDDIKVIVNKHNDYRRKVAKGLEKRGVNGPQPKAADMYELVWDPVLAASAQRWTDQCPKGHDKNRLIPGFAWVGQNFAESGNSVNTPDKLLEDKISMWYEEVPAWPASNVGKFSENGATGTIGHYTQLIWGETTKVGCGFVSFQVSSDEYKQILICNYGIGGNMSGSKVYTATTGAPGSACPKGTNDGLCKQ